MKKKVGITIVAILCIALICVGYYFLKKEGAASENEALTKVQKITTLDLEKEYPETPREVVKLYNKIISAFHQEEYTQEELEKMCQVAYELMDDELQANNPFDSYLISVQADVELYEARKKEIVQTDVCDSNDVLYKTDSATGEDLAYVSASYFVREDKEYTNTYQMYVMVKDEDGKWKIKVYYQIEAPKEEE
ncbi:MAG: hypothetical protein J6B26_00385 [Agathobacter sp.]|nr:hypothetical protein [Agathobacter sp.]MBQ2282547.1 hypothetical protein [Agathobacter sp.]